METVKDLIEALQEYDPNTPVRRQMTSEFGTTEIENIRFEDGKVVID